METALKPPGQGYFYTIILVGIVVEVWPPENKHFLYAPVKKNQWCWPSTYQQVASCCQIFTGRNLFWNRIVSLRFMMWLHHLCILDY